MVSLWGSKKGDEHENDEEGEQPSNDERPTGRQSTTSEPDERTRLLPPRNDGYLDPGDPAVRSARRYTHFQKANER